MPTESPSVGPSDNAGAGHHPALPSPASLKCFQCGAASLGPTDGVIYFGETIDRMCAACVRDQAAAQGADASPSASGGLGAHPRADRAIVIDLAQLQGGRRGSSRCRRSATTISTPSPASSSTTLPPVPDEHEPTQSSDNDDKMVEEANTQSATAAVDIPIAGVRNLEIETQEAKSMPAARTHPWATAHTTPAAHAVPAPAPIRPTIAKEPSAMSESPANPLLDVGRLRQRSHAQGCLYPGSVFKGTQRSGRSSYEVEVKFVDVNFDDWTLSGYLTIDGLTDSHPHLTTFFDGEIIGPKYGFITGQRFGATEVDDRRHWERFEQFLRPATKSDIVRPEMLLRDPLPDKSRGETTSRERDFTFLRIKEKFLVPDHRQRDISGASFAGFYYAMVDMSSAIQLDDPPSPSSSRIPLGGARRQSSAGVGGDSPRRISSSLPSGRPDATRRASTSGTRPDAPRRQSSSRPAPRAKEATIRGYYFHSLNQEPFQELTLTHVPSRCAGTFELR